MTYLEPCYKCKVYSHTQYFITISPIACGIILKCIAHYVTTNIKYIYKRHHGLYK